MMLTKKYRTSWLFFGVVSCSVCVLPGCPPGRVNTDSATDTSSVDTVDVVTDTVEENPVDVPVDLITDTGVDTGTDVGTDTGTVDVADDLVDVNAIDSMDIPVIDAQDADDVVAQDTENDTGADVVDDTLPKNCVFLQPGPAHGPDDGTYCSIGQDVPGAVIPTGFCMRSYARVNHARVMALAPNGDLFVTSPLLTSAGRNPDDSQPAAPPGLGAIVVLSDDNHDGVSEQTTFASNLFDVHGIAINGGYVWFTSQNGIYRTPYTSGQRTENQPMRELYAAYPAGDPFPPAGASRWTHGISVSSAGRVITTMGVWGATCPDPNVGHIFRADLGSMTSIASGFRNPMYTRCHFRDDVCFAAELGDDGGSPFGAREKIISLRGSGTYGFPCCSTTNVQGVPPFGGQDAGPIDCSSITAEEASFPLNDTPFGFDWEHGSWPTEYRNGMFVALHGSYYTFPRWGGARIVFAPADPSTHIPTGPWQTFIGGFGPCDSPLQRPADVLFAQDGRMFVADDQGNTVYFVAPVGLRRQ